MILDRERLIETADDAYGLAEAEYASVMGVPLNGEPKSCRATS